MTALQVSRFAEFGDVRADDPVLQTWLKTMRARTPHFAHEDDPQHWVGIRVGGTLLAAMAYIMYADGTVLIQALLCAPRKAGRVAVEALWQLMKRLWEGRRIIFFTATDNRKMLRAIPDLTTARPVATLFEIGGH